MAALPEFFFVKFNETAIPARITTADIKSRCIDVYDLIDHLCKRPELAGVGSTAVTVHSPDDTTQYDPEALLTSLDKSFKALPLIVKFTPPQQGKRRDSVRL